jgi:hypothetical protein
LLNIDATMFVNPLNTDKAQTNAVVATTTPHTDTMEMMLMALCDFFEKRYRRAM